MQFWFLPSPISIFSDQQFYAAKRYIHVTEEVEEDTLFVLLGVVIPAASAGGIGPLAVYGNSRADATEAKDAPILLSGLTLNIRLEYMVELRRQSIAINDDNDLAPDNVPRQVETTTGTGNLRREGIICPRKAGNHQNSFASFIHCSHDAILCMSLLQLFLNIFSKYYLEDVLIADTNKGLSVPMDLQEFIKWVGCWLYMAFWFGIESRRYWCSATTPLMAKVSLFILNRIMSRKQFDYILSAIYFTNR